MEVMYSLNLIFFGTDMANGVCSISIAPVNSIESHEYLLMIICD